MLAQANMRRDILDLQLTLSIEDAMQHMQLCGHALVLPALIRLLLYYRADYTIRKSALSLRHDWSSPHGDSCSTSPPMHMGLSLGVPLSRLAQNRGRLPRALDPPESCGWRLKLTRMEEVEMQHERSWSVVSSKMKLIGKWKSILTEIKWSNKI